MMLADRVKWNKRVRDAKKIRVLTRKNEIEARELFFSGNNIYISHTIMP